MPRFKNSIRPVLEDLRVDQDRVYIVQQLDRTTYQDVNRVLEALGGKWSKKEKAHVFAFNPTDVIEEVIETGQYTSTKRDLQQFYTPLPVAQKVVQTADIRPKHSVMEPSAGRGDLLAPMPLAQEVVAIEKDPASIPALKEAVKILPTPKYHVEHADFLAMTQHDMDQFKLGTFDRIIMNPPFSRQQDIDHVRHALNFLKSGGILVAIMSAGVRFRGNEKTRAFREEMFHWGGYFEPLPDDAFRTSGTDVRTVMLTVRG